MILICLIASPKNKRWKDLVNQLRGQSIYENIVSQNGQYKLCIVPPVFNENKTKAISQAHKNCIKRAKKMNAEYVLVMEDDVMFTGKKNLEAFLKQIRTAPKNWEVIISGCYGIKEKLISKFKKGLNRINDVIGFHCYAVSSDYYEFFLEANERANIDRWITRKEKGAITYLCWPMLTRPRNGISLHSEKKVNYDQETNKYLFKK